MLIIENIRTVNGFKYRDISKIIKEHNVAVPIATEVLSEHCGWIPDHGDPSFDCNKCDKNCIEYQKWIQFYEDYNLL